MLGKHLLSVFNKKRSDSIKTKKSKTDTLGHFYLKIGKAQDKINIHDGETNILRNLLKRQPIKKILSEITVLVREPSLNRTKQYLSRLTPCLKGSPSLTNWTYTHFYIKGLDKIVEEFVKKYKFFNYLLKKEHPIKPNRHPEKCCNEMSIHLLGPLPSKNTE